MLAQLAGVEDGAGAQAAAGRERVAWLGVVLTAAWLVLLVTATVLPTLGMIAYLGGTAGQISYLKQGSDAFQYAQLNIEWLRWIHAPIQLLAHAFLIGGAILLFRQRRHNRFAEFVSFTFLGFGSVNGFSTQFFAAANLLPLFYPLQDLVWGMMQVTIVLFPNGRLPSSWLRWTLALLAVQTTLAGFSLIPPWWAGALGISILALGIIGLMQRYRAFPAGRERQQIRWASFGFVVGAGFVIAGYVSQTVAGLAVAPSVQRVAVTVNAFSYGLDMFFMFGGVLISLLKFRLYDSDVVIARSVAYGSLTVLLLAAFAGSEKVIELAGEEWFGARLGIVAGGLGAAFAAAMIVPLHHRLSHWAEHKFQKQLIKLRHGLPLLLGDLRETAPVARIAAAVLDATVHGVRASRAALLVGEQVVGARKVTAHEVDEWRLGWLPSPEPGPDLMRGDALFPLRLPLEADGHGRVGWLLLGPRPDGSFYGKDERATLAEIADPVARALEIAAAREALQVAEAERWKRQDDLNAQLVGALGALQASIAQGFEAQAAKFEQLLAPPSLAAE